MQFSVTSDALFWLLLLVVSPSSQGETILDSARVPSGAGPSGETVSTVQEVPTHAQGPEEDKRGWQNLQSNWGKRGWQNLQGNWGKRSWQDLQGGWGKRAWQSLQTGWDKQTWDKFHGLWGKRDSDLNFDVSSLDNGMADADLAEEESGEDMKRAWSLLKGGWGKRAPVWGNLRGYWGKRDPAWSNLKALWGKRSDASWNRLPTVWGKRSVGGQTGIQEDPARELSDCEEWEE